LRVSGRGEKRGKEERGKVSCFVAMALILSTAAPEGRQKRWKKGRERGWMTPLMVPHHPLTIPCHELQERQEEERARKRRTGNLAVEFFIPALSNFFCRLPDDE